MKAIIPVAGVGTRLRPHTYTQPKPLIPVAGKPILGFIIDKLLDAGFREFVFVIGYFGEKIEAYVSKNYPQIKAYFVVQHAREGLGHAIWLTRDLIQDDEEIFIALGDTIFELKLEEILDSPYSCLGVKKVNDPRNFGVAEFSEDGFITRTIEKPEIPKSNMALVGIYKIKESNLLMHTLGKIIESDHRTQGEIQLTDAIQHMIDSGVRFRGNKVSNWYDCGKKEILLETNAKLLRSLDFASGTVPEFENTIIVPPVSIGSNCQISNTILGPDVTIGDNARIRYAIISDSIIGDYALIDSVVLQQSVVGSDSSINGSHQSLNIGDNTEIDWS